MKKSSQIQSVDASTSAVPERVSVAMAEIAEDMCEGLLALAVGAGLQVMAALMEADVTALAGPKGRHDGARTAVRHGREPGSVTLGGRRVPVTRPRVRARRRRQQRSPVCRELHGPLSGQDGRGLQQRPLGKPVGLHFKGPVWVSTVDGSEVGAAPVATVNREGAIPQLLLKANQNQGQGMFSKVTYVQRLRTTGGVAPAGSCPEGSQHAIRYSALYRFWAATPDLFNVLAPGAPVQRVARSCAHRSRS